MNNKKNKYSILPKQSICSLYWLKISSMDSEGECKCSEYSFLCGGLGLISVTTWFSQALPRETPKYRDSNRKWTGPYTQKNTPLKTSKNQNHISSV